MKKWTVNSPDEALAKDFTRQCDLSLLALKLLTSRGFKEFKQIAEFFSADGIEDPFSVTDMRAAVDTINEYIDSGRKICIYGDYDCDGITSSAVLYSYLMNMGANVSYFINERADGYGMNINNVRRLHDEGVELIVTVDNGISCFEEAEEIYRLGMKLVITDHHTPSPELPRCEACINPHRPDCTSAYKDLAGVGVAFKLCAALDGGDYDMMLEQYSDIVAIGTVADLVPLTGENRVLVRKGLMYLENTENYAINELIDSAGIKRDKLNSGVLGFQIAPRINAAGRFASPLLALEALLCEDQQEASELVKKLVSLNEQRRKTEALIFEEICRTIDEHPELLNDRVLVISGKGWHHGVIGIVSSRVLEKYGKPNVIISIEEDGCARGSARSLPGFNIYNCFDYAAELLDKFGGHECAGGLSLTEDKIPEFRRLVNEYAAGMKEMPCALTECDMVLSPQDMNIEAISSLDALQPFGVGNPSPVFFFPDCTVNAVTPLSGGKHTKLKITYAGVNAEALMFSVSPDDLFFRAGAHIDIAASAEINEFNGNKSISLKVKDIKPKGFDTNRYIAAKNCCEQLMNGEKLPKKYIERMIPSRDEMAFIYKKIREVGTVSADDLFLMIGLPQINYGKLWLSIQVFCDAKLAEFSASTGKVKLMPVTGKADLQQTKTMRYLGSILAQAED